MRVPHVCSATLAALLLLAMPVAAQELTRTDTARFTLRKQGRKSPLVAEAMGIIPGLGHVYAGEGLRGVAFLGGILTIALAGGSISDAQCRDPVDEYGMSTEYCSSEALDIATAVATGGVWVWSIVDAGTTAKRTNRRRGFAAVENARLLLVADSRRPGVRIGLSIATR